MSKYILFDLDGTLTDSAEGITKSLQYGLNKLGIHVENIKDLEIFVGPPLANAAMEYYGLTQEQADLMLIYYREKFKSEGIFQNKVYEGIPKLLFKLKNNGNKCGLATSKPEVFAVQILEYFHLDQYFDFIIGNTLDDQRPTKSEIIRCALEMAKGYDLSEVFMVGDRKYDIQGAKENGIKSIGVSYGYGSKEELEAAGADAIAASVSELEKILF